MRIVFVLPLLLASLALAATTQPVTTPLTVLDDAAKPVVDATVVVVPAPPKVMTYFIFDGDLKPPVTFPYRQYRTDIAGRCNAVVPAGAGSVIAFSEAGWARTKLSELLQSNAIYLRPWARVTGRLLAGNQPQAGERIRILSDLQPEDVMADRAMIERTAVTDADGRFTIDHVPPEAVRIAHAVQPDGRTATPSNNETWDQSVVTTLSPGRTFTLTLGGQGRPVTGSIAPPADSSQLHWTATGTISRCVVYPKLPMPSDIALGNADVQSAWFDAFQKTKAYAAYQSACKQLIEQAAARPLRWIDARKFRVDDVTAGDYRIEITLRTADGNAAYTSVPTRFTLPETKSAQASETFDIPPIELRRPAAKATVGGPAVDFSVTRLDGKSVKLSDYRGKILLVDFWATWCPACLEQVPKLKALHQRFAGEERFAMLSISFDESAARAKAYVDAQQMAGDQAWAGDPVPPVINEAYLNGLPTLLLIDADGRVMYTRGYDLDAVTARIEAELRQR